MSNHCDNPAQPGPDRRGFLRTAGLIGAGLALSGAAHAQDAPRPLELTDTGPDRIPRKPFGAPRNGFLSSGWAATAWVPPRPSRKPSPSCTRPSMPA